MAINYSSPGVPGGEVSPGAGSTGFSSRGVAFGNASGQITNTSSFAYDSTQGFLGVGTTAPAFALDMTTSTGTKVQLGSSVQLHNPAAKQLQFRMDGAGIYSFTTAAMTVGTSALGLKLSLPSTVNMSSAVGVAGGAAALPATPESYIKVLAPGNNGTLTTLYIPAYLST